MASRILSPADALKHEPLQWRHVGDHSDPPDSSMPEEKSAALVEDREESIQHRIREQCELAYRQGEATGRKSAQAELDDKFKALGRAIESAASHKARLRQEAERDVVELALAVARRLVRRQIQVDEESILGLVKAAFENASLREITQVRVNPQLVAVVQGHLQSLGAPVSIELIGDPSLELSGVMVETARGCLDASAETQLDEIGRGFADAMSVTGRRT